MIAISIFMMAVPLNNGEFLSIGSHLLAGYLSKYTISAKEQTLLYMLVLGRYAQTVVLCAVECSKQGGQNEYLDEVVQLIEGNVWPQLEYMMEKGEAYVMDRLYSK